MVALIFLCLNLVTSLRYELVINLKTAKALGLIVKREGIPDGWPLDSRHSVYSRASGGL
jgi:hypothetical protein